jgi:hypothetical protein
MRASIAGRVRNTHLPKAKSLLPLFEAAPGKVIAPESMTIFDVIEKRLAVARTPRAAGPLIRSDDAAVAGNIGRAAVRVAVSSVIKWSGRKRRLGSAAPGKMGGYRPYLMSGALIVSAPTRLNSLVRPHRPGA